MNKYLIVGLVIIIGANIAALAGVAYNRSGEPEFRLLLTERELGLPYMNPEKRENSRHSLRIKWRMPSEQDELFEPHNKKHIQTDRASLDKLGFTGELQDNSHYTFNSHEIYIALEYDGELYARDVAKIEDAVNDAKHTIDEGPREKNKDELEKLTKHLNIIRSSTTRLYFAGAALTFDELKTVYQARENIFIVKAIAHASRKRDTNQYFLTIDHLAVPSVMLPTDLAPMFVDLYELRRDTTEPPRYAVQVNWGKRLEPWIVGANLIAE